MKKIIIILAFCAIAVSATAQQNIKEPYYMIDFNVVHCKFEIYINKVHLMTWNVNGHMKSRMPCNHLILGSGVQQMDIFVYPAGETFSDETKLSVKLMLYDVAGDGFELVQNNIVNWEMSDNEKTNHTLHFNAQVPYSFNPWQQSADLNTVENLRQKVEAAHQKLGKMLVKKQYDAFISMIEEKEKRVATSLYLDEKSKSKRMDFKELESGFELVPLSGTETMHLYADGRLVCLKSEDGEDALRFLNKKTQEEIFFEIMFHLKKGDTELTVSP